MQFNQHGYLPAGLHDMELCDIQSYFVDGFPQSNTRQRIFEGYSNYRIELETLDVHFIQFLDGSFTTTKNDPADIDLVCFANALEIDQLTAEQKEKFADLTDSQSAKASYLCDAYFCPTLPEDHPLYQKTRTARKYWMGEFGNDRQDRPKGIVRTEMGGQLKQESVIEVSHG